MDGEVSRGPIRGELVLLLSTTTVSLASLARIEQSSGQGTYAWSTRIVLKGKRQNMRCKEVWQYVWGGASRELDGKESSRRKFREREDLNVLGRVKGGNAWVRGRKSEAS